MVNNNGYEPLLPPIMVHNGSIMKFIDFDHSVFKTPKEPVLFEVLLFVETVSMAFLNGWPWTLRWFMGELWHDIGELKTKTWKMDWSKRTSTGKLIWKSHPNLFTLQKICWSISGILEEKCLLLVWPVHHGVSQRAKHHFWASFNQCLTTIYPT